MKSNYRYYFGDSVDSSFVAESFVLYGKDIVDIAWSEEYRKNDGLDGYAVSANIDESDVLHVVNDMEYALDLGEGESYTRQGYVDCMTGEISFNAEVVDFNKEAFEELFFVDYKRVNDVFDEIRRGISRVSMGIDEEYTTPKCDMLIEGDERGELLQGVSVTFKREANKN